MKCTSIVMLSILYNYLLIYFIKKINSNCRLLYPMDSILPKPEDHCRVQVLIKPIGKFPDNLFNQLLKKLETKLDRVEVLTSQNIRRIILPKFISEVNPNLTKFAEFQAFRKIFGLICVGQYNGAQWNTSSSFPDLSPPKEHREKDQNHLRRTSIARISSVDVDDPEAEAINLETKQMTILKNEYQKAKQEFNDQLVDSRCVLFGFNSDQNSTEILTFPRYEDLSFLSEQLEIISRELLRSIYVVLDSKRLDASFERMESPPYPILPDEEKYRMGVENTKSKMHRKKCIGRLRKRLSDYALLTGYFDVALISYQSAIDLLKTTSDFLWLAAACEGWCCAGMMLKYGDILTHSLGKINISTFTLLQKAQNHANSPNTNGEIRSSTGHHRNRSDEAAKLLGIGTDFSMMPNSVVTTDISPPSSGEISPQDEQKNDIEVAEPNSPDPSNKFTRKTADKKRKIWQQLLNFDTLSSMQLPDKTENALINFENLPVPSASGMSSASRSASAQNLVHFASSNSTAKQQITGNQTANGVTTKMINNSKKTSISRNELLERFHQSLESYGRFSFAIFVEYECVMRAVHLPIVQHQYIEVESFLREHTCRFLDDKFTHFNNTMKSNICLATAEVYNLIGFKRKSAFFLRLAVFFRLYMENHSGYDYRKVYAYLNESLTGYGVGSRITKNNKIRGLKAQYLAKIGSSNTYSLQIKAVHEVFTVAMRSGLHEIATRHLCYMLENFYEHLDKAASFALIEELNKLNQINKDNLHCLDKPITLDSSPPVFLPPLQFTKFPTLKSLRILPLPPHLAPRVIDTSSLQSEIFIYSPFQDRFKNKDDIYWIVNNEIEIAVHAENPLPIDLIVNNLTLITEDCQFEAIPIRLNLPSCYKLCIDPLKKEIKFLGKPRSVGMLKIVGYTCEVLGCRNVCRFVHKEEELKKYTVRVLPNLPILQPEISLKRTPTLSDNPNDAIAEVYVFSGQSFIHTITLYNQSESIDIKSVTVKIQQPQVVAGQKLLKIINMNKTSDDKIDYQLYDIKAKERRKMDILIFGIDPVTATPYESINKNERKQESKAYGDKKVYVRRPTSTSLATIMTDNELPETLPREETKSEENKMFRVNSSNKSIDTSVSTPLLEQQSEDAVESVYHDLIPYTGRLLSAEFTFNYIADLKTENGEEYMRFAKLPLAITIVPAVNVSNWNILAGDSPFTRYIVVDVSNQTDSEAELSYGPDKRKITVQPKEICRVPIICSCCTEIKSVAFQRATQRASYVMQIQEIEILRRKIEKHVTKHLEIQWTIPQLNLNGQVPIGSLLSSVSFLRQLVLPSLTLAMDVDQKSGVNDGDITVKVGEIINIKVSLYCSIGGELSGELSIICNQDTQNNQTPLEHAENLFICGAEKIPFSINGLVGTRPEGLPKNENGEVDRPFNAETSHFSAEFSTIFCYEGIHKIRPRLENLKVKDEEEFCLGQTTKLNDDDIFMPTLSFSVISKL